MPRARLGYFIHTPAIGGAEKYCRDLIRGAAHTYDVTVFHQPWPELKRFLSDSLPESVTWIEVETGDTRTIVPSLLTATARRVARPLLRRIAPPAISLIRAIRAGKYEGLLANSFRANPVDLLHVINGGFPGSAYARAAIVAAHQLGAKTIMSICSSPTPAHFFERPSRRALVACLDAAVAPSPIIAMDMEKRLLGTTVRSIPWGIPPITAFSPSFRSSARRELDLAETDFVLGMVGRLATEKNHQAVLKVAAKLVVEIPSLRVVIVGEGPERRSLEVLTMNLGLSGNVRFLGYQPDLLRALASFDFLVIPSIHEGLPYVLLEALSARLPVICTRVGAIPEYFQDEKNGLLIEPGNDDALQSAIRRIITDPSLLTRIVDGGSKMFDATFHIDRMLSAHFELYEETLG